MWNIHNQNMFVWGHCKSFFEVKLLKIYFPYRNFYFPFILLIFFVMNAVLFHFPYTLSFLIFLILCEDSLRESICFYLDLLNLLSLNQSQISQVPFRFPQRLYVVTEDMSHQHIRRNLILQIEAYHWHKEGTVKAQG